MLNLNLKNDLIEKRKINLIKSMQTKAELKLNPFKYHLSVEAKKRLRWMYILYHEQGGNVSRTANNIGISRQWLSYLRNVFEKSNRNPRSLEPESKAPRNTGKRNRIDKSIEGRIMWVRNEYGWGKDKIAAYLKDNEDIKVSHNTVNRYLHVHKKIDPKISLKNSMAMKSKKEREKDIDLKAKFRPPSNIKDLAPGALVEKDMKYIIILGVNNEIKLVRNFWYQQTCIDSFTRIRTMELTKDFESLTVTMAHKEALKRMPFNIACINVDNGSENKGYFSEYLQKENVFQFYSNTATPTDNPRVERSHLSDELEFYKRGNHYSSFEKQKEALRRWEYIYNYIRPHQALGQMTPMAFYELWKKDPEEAMKITEKWQAYLKKQSKRLANSRKIKRKEQIESLMKFIDAKLEDNNGLKKAKLQLINCQLCSMA
jgi:hypothetical protein